MGSWVTFSYGDRMRTFFLKKQWAFFASFAFIFAVVSACGDSDSSSSVGTDSTEIESDSSEHSSDSEEMSSGASSSSKKKSKSSSSKSKTSSSSKKTDASSSSKGKSSSSQKTSSSSKKTSSSSQKDGSGSSAVEESSSSFWHPDTADMNPFTCKTEGLVSYILDENNDRVMRICQGGKWVEVESSSSAAPRSSGSTPSTCEVFHFNMDSLFNPSVDYKEFTDTRDGQKYKTVEIDLGGMSFVVFAQNLNYGTQINGLETKFNDDKVEKYCLEDDPWYCENGFGGLYTWSEAMGLPYACNSALAGSSTECSEKLSESAKSDEDWASLQVQGVCPDGWHILNEKEWFAMTGRNKYVGDLISRMFGSLDDYGFSALPGGLLNTPGGIEYELAPDYGFMWLPQEFDAKYAHAIAFSTAIWDKNLESVRKSSGLSVRCVKNYKAN